MNENKIKVLHVIASNFYGGPEKQIKYHCKFIDKSKFNISVASFSEGNTDNQFIELLNKDKVPTFLINHKFLLDFSIISQLRNIINKNNIDILITHGYKSNIIGYYANKTKKIPHTMYVRGWTAEGWRIKLYNKLELRYLKKADQIVTVANSKINELTKLGIAQEKIQAITNAVEIPLENSASLESLKNKFNIPESNLTILAAGRLSPEKGHEQLLYALQKLLSSKSSFTTVIFGDGPLKDHLIELTKRLDLEKNVIFAGFEADWKKYLNDADILINPSLSEVMPNVVLESLMHKCPVIATDVGGVKELIKDGYSGFLAEPNNPDSIYDCIQHFLNNKHRISEIINNGYDHVIENFSFESQADKLQQLYTELYETRRDQ